MKKIAMATLCFLGVASAEPKGSISTEVFPSNAGVLVDSKASINIGDKFQFSYLGRNRLSVSSEGNINNFLLQELNAGAKSINGHIQFRVLNGKSSGWVGATYIHKSKDLFAMVQTNVGLFENPVGELMTIVKYNPRFSSGHLAFEYEGIHWLGDSLHGTSRIHIGYSPLENFTVGVCTEFEYGININPDVKAGGFIRVSK